MSTDTLARPLAFAPHAAPVPQPGLCAWLRQRLQAAWTRWAEARAMSRALDELAEMEEHRLHDIGLSASDLHALRLHRACRRPWPGTAGDAELLMRTASRP